MEPGLYPPGMLLRLLAHNHPWLPKTIVQNFGVVHPFLERCRLYKKDELMIYLIMNFI